MSFAVAFNGLKLDVLEYENTWALSNKQVAEGFGVSEEAIRSQKSRGEYQNNVHFYTVANCNGGADLTFWTKKGVVTLGFKLRETPQTIAFRDWASDFILKSDNIVSNKNINLNEIYSNLNDLRDKLSELGNENAALKAEIAELSAKYIVALESENELLKSAAAAPILGRRLSAAEREKIAALYKAGESKAAIARQTRRSETAIANALRSLS